MESASTSGQVPSLESIRSAPDFRRLPPRPLLDEEDDIDEEEEYYRDRRRREAILDRAASKVSTAANGLLAVAVIGLIFGPLGVVINLVQTANIGDADEFVAINLFSGVLHVVLSLLILVGSMKLKRLENVGLAKAAAIIAMIPWVSPCCFLGLPFGIQALNAMRDPDVVEAFQINIEERVRRTGNSANPH